MTGYVKLHRSAIDHRVFDDPFLWHLFCWCLIKANYRDSNYMGVVIPAGSFVTGRNSAADQLHIAPSKWQRGMEKLASPQFACISITPNSKWTMVSVCNYSTYQFCENETEQQVNSVRTANEQQVNTSKEVNNTRNEEVNTLVTDAQSKPKGVSASRFVPPTLEEAQAEIEAKGYQIDAHYFIDFYEAQDWKFSGGIKMKSWKKAMSRWHHNSRKSTLAGQQKQESRLPSDEEIEAKWNPHHPTGGF